MKYLPQVLLGFYLLIIFVAGAIAPEYYFVIRNTVSELASQGFPNAWFMRLGFFVLGAAVIFLVFLLSKSYTLTFLRVLALLVLLLYGGAVLVLGGWSDKNFFVLNHNMESFVHAFFLRVAAFFFLISVWLNAVAVKQKSFTVISLVILLLVLFLNYIFYEFVEYQGLTQRIMQLLFVYWLMKLSTIEIDPDDDLKIDVSLR